MHAHICATYTCSFRFDHMLPGTQSFYRNKGSPLAFVLNHLHKPHISSCETTAVYSCTSLQGKRLNATLKRGKMYMNAVLSWGRASTSISGQASRVYNQATCLKVDGRSRCHRIHVPTCVPHRPRHTRRTAAPRHRCEPVAPRPPPSSTQPPPPPAPRPLPPCWMMTLQPPAAPAGRSHSCAGTGGSPAITPHGVHPSFAYQHLPLCLASAPHWLGGSH